MQRNLTLVRKILEDIENSYRGLKVDEVTYKGFTVHQVKNHWGLLQESGFIASCNFSGTFILTWDGHNLLDELKLKEAGFSVVSGKLRNK